MTDPCQRVAAWCFLLAAVLTVVGCATTPAPQPKPIPLRPEIKPASFAAQPPMTSASAAEVVAVVVTPMPTPQAVVVVAASGSHADWLTAAGIPQSDWQYVDYIVTRESGWQVTVANPSSGSYGLCQALPRTKMATA